MSAAIRAIFRKPACRVNFCKVLCSTINKNIFFQEIKRELTVSAPRTMAFAITERGTPYSTDYRVFFQGNDGPVSPFHDIPLFADKLNKVYNMVVEIPRWTNAKMEIATNEVLNPIKQDVKKGNVRFVCNSFPHHGYIWNYGAFPQTWENPNKLDESTGTKGDNDPIDVCEIGQKVARRGEVLPVKVLGILALIDEGECDWKVIAIDINDPLANDLNDVEDVEKKMPGFLKATYEWFKIYKMPDGKPANTFAFNGEVKNKEFAEKIVEETHEQWKSLIDGTADPGDLKCLGTTLSGNNAISMADSEAAINAHPQFTEPAAIPANVNKWHYVHLR